MKVTVLMENTAISEEFEHKHGLSFYIEGNGKKILSDFGDNDFFINNAEKLGIDLSQVDFAIIEPNGQLSVLKKPEYEPLTPKDMSIIKAPTGISTELIYDGILIDENLRQLNKSKKWVMDQLKMHEVKDISQVFLATLTPSGSLYVDKYDDHMIKITDIGDFKGPY